MPANTAPIFPNVVANEGTIFLPADTTATKAIFTADATNGSRLDSLVLSNDDAAAILFHFYLYDGATDYTLYDFTTTIGEVGREILSGFPNLVDGSVFLKAGWSLRASADATITAADSAWFTATGGNY